MYAIGFSEMKQINLLDAKVASSFVCGGAFPYIIAYSFLMLIEDNIDVLMENI